MIELILIEDFAPLRRVLTQALRDAEFNVTDFEDGTVSSDADVMQHADLLITDIEMPSVGGRAVLNNIRQSSPNLRTIVISGLPDDKLEGIEACALLRKPFEPEELVSTVKRLLAEQATASAV